jgi:hypothetical protein
MTTLADYIVIRDTKFELRPHQEQTFTFDIYEDIVRSGGSKRPIIAFFADPSGNAKNLRCEFEINDQVIGDYRYSGGVGRGHWEVLRHENLNAGATNTIQFRVESGEGSVGFSDVILWFQRNV